MNRRQTAIPNDKEISDFIAERKASMEQSARDTKRWVAAMPKPLDGFWTEKRLNQISLGAFFDVKALSQALAQATPDVHTRILDLLTWFGKGKGPWWALAPGYEQVVESLLLEFPTAELLAAIQSKELTEVQMDGAARLFVSWAFSKERPDDVKKLPTELKQLLLQQALRNADELTRSIATETFK